jgi:hypothetical protein
LDASEAGLAVLEQQLRDADPLTDGERSHAVIVDGRTSDADTALTDIWARVLQRLAGGLVATPGAGVE